MTDRILLKSLPFVPSGPPPTAGQFAAECRAAQRDLLWARHDKRSRRAASQAVERAWNLMRYMGAKDELPRLAIAPDLMLRMRPEQAAGEALRALSLAIAWAERQPDFRRSA